MTTTPLCKNGVSPFKLTDKRRRFVAEYKIDANKTRAAVAAGYSKKSARSTAYKLLQEPVIQKMIGKDERIRLEKAGLQADQVLEKVANSVNRSLFDLCDEDGNVISNIHDIPKRAHCFIDGMDVKQFFDSDGNIAGQTIKFKFSPNAQAQDMGMRHNGLYAPEKIETKQQVVSLDLSLTEPPEHPKHEQIERIIKEAGDE